MERESRCNFHGTVTAGLSKKVEAAKICFCGSGQWTDQESGQMKEVTPVYEELEKSLLKDEAMTAPMKLKKHESPDRMTLYQKYYKRVERNRGSCTKS